MANELRNSEDFIKEILKNKIKFVVGGGGGHPIISG